MASGFVAFEDERLDPAIEQRARTALSRTVLEAALEAGITFIDTADIYGNGRSEEIIGKTLGSRRDRP